MFFRTTRRRQDQDHVQRRRICLQHLEDRLAPAIITFDGGPSGTGTEWTVAANWSGDVLPGSGDEAQIGTAFSAKTITHGTGTTFVQKAFSEAAVTITGGTLELGNATSSFNKGVTIATGGSLSLDKAKINGAVTILGTLIARQSSALNAAVTTALGSLIQVQSQNTFNNVLTVANGFTNLGTIELNSIVNPVDATLTVTNGTLVNAPGANIKSLVGAGGTRALNAEVNNQGQFTIDRAMTLDRSGADHQNSGTITVNQTLLVNQTGNSPSFSTNSAITIGAGGTLDIRFGDFNYTAGTLSGPGTLQIINATANVTPDLSNATTSLSFDQVTYNGPGKLTNANTLVLSRSKINTTLINQGHLILVSDNTLSGPIVTNPGTVMEIRAGVPFFENSLLTVPNGFTNLGTVELTASVSAGNATLKIPSGSLINDASGTIKVSTGAGGSRNLDCELNNKGNMTVDLFTTLNRSSANHLNSGTITLNGFFLVPLSGTSPSFSTSGTFTINAGATLSVRQPGDFNFTAGTLGGLGTLQLINVTANMTPNFSNAATSLDFDQVNYNGPGTLTNASKLTLTRSTINTTLTNQGTLTLIANNTFNAALVTNPGTLIELRSGVPFLQNALLTVPDGFTNLGTIEMTSIDSFGEATLRTVSGTFINDTSGTIKVLAGGGGTRNLECELNNKGTITFERATLLNRASADHVNTGTMTLDANLSVVQSGTTPSFSTIGTMTIAVGKTLQISNGDFNYQAGVLGGPGTIDFNTVVGNFTPDFSNAVTSLTMINAIINGPGKLTNVKTLDMRGSTFNTSLTNQGTIVLLANNTFNGSLITNPGSLIELRGGVPFVQNSLLTVPDGFTNLGTIEMTSLDNIGDATLRTVSGTIINDTSGTIKVLAGGGGSRNIISKLDNQGTLQVDAFTLITGELVNFAGATLTGGKFSINNLLRFPNADIVNNSAAITLNGPAAKIQSSTGIDAFAKFANNQAAGSLTLDGNHSFAPFNDLANAGTINVKSGSTLSLGLKSFNQSGGITTVDGVLSADTSNFSGGTLSGVGTINGAVNNSGGTVQPGAGAFTINGDLTQSATGSTDVPVGRSLVTINGGKFEQVGGTTKVDGTLVPAAKLNLTGGTVTGNGTIASDVNNVGGTVAPGSSPGILTITGNYTQAAGGALNIELNGATPGTLYDRLLIQGAIVLDGTMPLNLSFAAATNDSFTVVDNQGAGALTGTFTNIPNGVFLINGMRLLANYSGGDGNDLTLTRLATAIDNIAIADGSSQRSSIRSITLAFGGLVTLPTNLSDALVLDRIGPGGPNGPVTLAVDTSASTANLTIAKITFAGNLTTFGSLIDGDYVLNVLGTSILDGAGQPVDGDGNGTIGGNTSRAFHRFFGDVDGDRDIDTNDFFAFRSTFMFSTGSSSFNAAFDFDGNGTINTVDFAQFRARFGLRLFP